MIAPIPVAINAALNTLAPFAAASSLIPTAINDLAKNSLLAAYNLVIPVVFNIFLPISTKSFPNSTNDSPIALNLISVNCLIA
jgi:hypothetical protein